MEWQFNSERPIYLQISEQIQKGILANVYQPGSEMPSVRALAVEAKVNPNTMQRALQDLELKGLLCTQRTTGRTVTTDTHLIAQIKQAMVIACIDDYLSKMISLGVDRFEAVQQVTEYVKANVNQSLVTETISISHTQTEKEVSG